MQFTVQSRIQNNSYLPYKNTYKITKSNQGYTGMNSSKNSRKHAKKGYKQVR